MKRYLPFFTPLLTLLVIQIFGFPKAVWYDIQAEDLGKITRIECNYVLDSLTSYHVYFKDAKCVWWVTRGVDFESKASCGLWCSTDKSGKILLIEGAALYKILPDSLTPYPYTEYATKHSLLGI